MKHKLPFFKGLVAVLILVTIAAGCQPQAPEAPPPTEAPTEAMAIQEDFVTWSYGVETIADNIKQFQEKNPNITITNKDYSWLDYHDTMVGAFTAGNSPELLYGSDHWLSEWAGAGWLEPLDDHCPSVKEYSAELAPYALQGITY